MPLAGPLPPPLPFCIRPHFCCVCINMICMYVLEIESLILLPRVSQYTYVTSARHVSDLLTEVTRIADIVLSSYQKMLLIGLLRATRDVLHFIIISLSACA